MIRTAAVCLLFAATVAQDEAQWSYTVTYKGQPVAGAKVCLVEHVFEWPGSRPREPVFATADEKGVVHFPRTDPSRGALARVLARDVAGHAGFGTLWDGNRNPLTLELHDTVSITGRVTDATGNPVAGLTRKPVALGPEKFRLFYGRPLVEADTPDWFWEAFPVRPAADGSFTLSGVPAGYSVALHFEAPGFGTGRFWLVPGRPNTVTLAKAGAVALRFTIPDGAKVGDVSVTVRRTAAGANDVLEASATGTVKSGVDLVLSGLPPGTYRIDFPYTGPAAFFPKPVGPVTVKPGETAQVTTPLEPAARVTARLTDSKTGQGVAGAGLNGSVVLGPEQATTVAGPKADADGKVELLVPAGMVSVTPVAPDGYAVGKFTRDRFGSLATEPVPVAPGQAHDFGRFALVQTVDLPGTIVDEAGRPVSGAKVSTGYSQGNGAKRPAVSDSDGGFVLRGINPEGGLFGVTARRRALITAAPVAVDPAKPEAIRVVVSEKFGAKLRGRVVDRAGQPISGVGIDLMHSVKFLNRSGGMLGFGTGHQEGTTGADGRFETDVQQAGDSYQLTLSAPGFRSATTAEWVTKPGETHDFGDVVLTRADFAVSGTVTDLAGKPVASATVFNNADGPRPAQATTDAAGRFTLNGLYQGPAYVSVKANGFRVAAVPVDAGGPPVTVALRRLSDPPAAPPVISDAHKQATAKLTRHLLEALWANRVAANDGGQLVLRAMARLDPDTARKWRDEEKRRTGGRNDLTPSLEAGLRDRTLLATACGDADEAVALLKSVGGTDGFRAVCKLATDLLPDAPDKALRVAEEAVARARGFEQVDRVWALAWAGELVYRAGRKDAGRKLIEEAAAAAGPLDFWGLDAYRRGMVACRVALYDPAKARAMIDPMTKVSDFNRWLRQCCLRRAEVDLPMAKKWLADLRPVDNNSPHCDLGRQLMVHRLARTAPDEAAALARSIDHPMARAVTFADLAVHIPDRARASRLIDEAIDRIVTDMADPLSLGSGTPGLVLYGAKQIGHPDLAGVRDKVLAARTAPRANPSGRPSEDIRLALTLALTDPETARFVLARALQPAERAGIDGRRGQQKLIAFALADPSAADALVDVLVARVAQAKAGYRLTGLDALAEVLTQPDRLVENACRYGNLYNEFPEE